MKQPTLEQRGPQGLRAYCGALALMLCGASPGAASAEGGMHLGAAQQTQPSSGRSATTPRGQSHVARRLQLAAQGFGGAEALLKQPGVSYTANGQRYAPGQRVVPGGADRFAADYERAVVIDAGANAVRQDVVREVEYPFPAHTDYSNVVQGDRGYQSGTADLFGTPTGAMLSERVAAVRKELLLLNPQWMVRYALTHPDIAETRPSAHGLSALALDLSELGGGDEPFVLWLDPKRPRVVAAQTVENDHLLRDVTLVARYDDYRWARGLRLPAQLQLTVGTALALVEQRSSMEAANAVDPATFAFPQDEVPAADPTAAQRAQASHQWHQELEALAVPFDTLQDQVDPLELAEGVTLIGGSSHNSVVVEQQAGIVVLEAPLYPERSEAIIAFIHSRYPGKPITHVVATHHHTDHSAGLRAFVAEGASVVASSTASALYREVFAAPAT